MQLLHHSNPLQPPYHSIIHRARHRQARYRHHCFSKQLHQQNLQHNNKNTDVLGHRHSEMSNTRYLHLPSLGNVNVDKKNIKRKVRPFLKRTEKIFVKNVF